MAGRRRRRARIRARRIRSRARAVVVVLVVVGRRPGRRVGARRRLGRGRGLRSHRARRRAAGGARGSRRAARRRGRRRRLRGRAGEHGRVGLRLGAAGGRAFGAVGLRRGLRGRGAGVLGVGLDRSLVRGRACLRRRRLVRMDDRGVVPDPGPDDRRLGQVVAAVCGVLGTEATAGPRRRGDARGAGPAARPRRRPRSRAPRRRARRPPWSRSRPSWPRGIRVGRRAHHRCGRSGRRGASDRGRLSGGARARRARPGARAGGMAEVEDRELAQQRRALRPAGPRPAPCSSRFSCP